MVKKIYLKGLHPKIFATITADIKGNKSLTFKEVRERCLAFAVSDAAREELQGLLPAQGPPEFANSVVQDTLSPKTKLIKNLEKKVHMLMAQAPQGSAQTAASGPGGINCRHWEQFGKCPFGLKCKFKHSGAAKHESRTGNGQRTAPGTKKDDSKYCSFHKCRGHTDKECTKQNPSTLLAVEDQSQNPFGPTYSHEFDPFAFVVLSEIHHLAGRLVVDGAATSNCLNQLGRRHILEGTLHDIDPLTLRGTKPVVVTQRADASWPVLNPATLEVTAFHLKDCLIMDELPCSLLSQPKLLAKGCAVDTETKHPDTPQAEVTQTFSFAGVHVLTAMADASTNGLLIVQEPEPLAFENPTLLAQTNLASLFTNIIALVEFLYGEEEGPQPTAPPKFEETNTFSFLASEQPDLTESHALSTSLPAVSGAKLCPGSKPNKLVPYKRTLTKKQTVALFQTIHNRFKHGVCPHTISLLTGIPCPEDHPPCIWCHVACPRRSPSDPVSTLLPHHLHHIYSVDYIGPISPPTPEGHTGMFALQELFSKFLIMFGVKSQEEWCQIWHNHVSGVEAYTGRQRVVGILLSDQAKSHTSCGVCGAFHKQKGIQAQHSGAYSQQFNKVEGGMQNAMQNAATSMIMGGAVRRHKYVWGFAVKASFFASNMLPISFKNAEQAAGRSTFEVYYGRKPMTLEERLRYLPEFLVAMTAMKQPQHALTKFDEKATFGCSLGYKEHFKSFWMLDMEGNTIKAVAVDQAKFFSGVYPMQTGNPLYESLSNFKGVEDLEEFNLERARLSRGARYDVSTMRIQEMEDDDEVFARRFSGRTPFMSLKALEAVPDKPSDPVALQVMHCKTSGEPINFEFVLVSTTPGPVQQQLTPKSVKQAVEMGHKPDLLNYYKELAALNVFTNCTTLRPEGQIIPINMLFKNKNDPEAPGGSKLKVRGVCRGDLIKGYTPAEKQALTLRPESKRLLIAHAVAKGKKLYKYDFKNAFNATKMRKRGIICRLMPGFNPDGTWRPLTEPHLYGEMNMTVPGVPDGSLIFNEFTIATFKKDGWTTTPLDPCLLKKGDELTGLHVDDGAIEADNDEGMARHMRPFKDVKWSLLEGEFLGEFYKVTYTPELREVFVHQLPYSRELLKQSGLDKSNRTKTPSMPGKILSKSQSPTTKSDIEHLESLGLDKARYRSQTMAVSWLAQNTLQGLKQQVGAVAKFMNNPGEEHFQALKHLLRYINFDQPVGITYLWRKGDPTDLHLVADTDAAGASCPDTMCSIRAFAAFVNLVPISVFAKYGKQTDSSINTSETMAVREAILDHASFPSEDTIGAAAMT